MVRVTEVTDSEAPLALLVDNNAMSLYRMHEILRQKNYRIIECKDGDKAVDIFITEDPDIVVMSLDIPGLDGHIAALEMRESRNETRIIFTTPRSKLELSRDAAFSVGAVALLEKPVSQSLFDEMWDTIIGEIPEAPGIEDLDDLYPDIDDNSEEVEVELEELPPPPPPSALPALAPPPKRRRKGRGLLFIAIVLFVGAAGAMGYGLNEMGYLSF